jgi:hypothetical protein
VGLKYNIISSHFIFMKLDSDINSFHPEFLRSVECLLVPSLYELINTFNLGPCGYFVVDLDRTKKPTGAVVVRRVVEF